MEVMSGVGLCVEFLEARDYFSHMAVVNERPVKSRVVFGVCLRPSLFDAWPKLEGKRKRNSFLHSRKRTKKVNPHHVVKPLDSARHAAPVRLPLRRLK